MLSHSDFFRPVYKISCSTAFERSDACCFVENVLELSYLENRGAAFGIFQGKQWPLIIFTVIVLILIIYFYLMRIPAEKHFGLLNGIAILFLQVRSVTLLTGLRRDMWLISFISD